MKEEYKTLLANRLSRKIEKTKEKIQQMESMTQPISPENSIGRLSRMDAINNKSVQEAALRSAKADLAAYKLALNHLDDEAFGLCKKCGVEIPYQRLLLMPGTSHCVSCAR